jgi:hypothetical protein
MSTQMEADHPALLDAAHRLISHLRSFSDRMRPGEIDHAQHHEFAEQGVSLAIYLEGALRLAGAGLYPPAFGAVRSGMEHHALDRLLFLANRYRELISDVDDGTLADWQRRLSEGALSPDILSVERAGGAKVAIVRTGYHFQGQGMGPAAPTLSYLYHVLEEHDPFAGRPAIQEQLVGGYVGTLEPRVERARRHAEVWRDNLRWMSLRANLALNGFYTERELARWDVHHGFLSAFVHPTPRSRHAIWGHNLPSGAPRHDHYCSELTLLYVITFARLELEALGEMANRQPVVEIDRWEDVRAELAEAEAMSAYLWFPRGRPDPFDRVEEANRRGIRDGALVPLNERPVPDDLADDEVRYYENPLWRLIRMHSNINELTGFPYFSRWPREDALLRSMF